jgi:dimethylargininase
MQSTISSQSALPTPQSAIPLALLALVRPVPDSLARCELTHIERTPIDVTRAQAQHSAYERALTSFGCEVVRVPAAHNQADSVFIEDMAIVLEELAVITRPGAESRRDEAEAVASTLVAFRQLQFLSEPATLDGGDMLRLGRTLYVGVGGRTNAAGVQQLRDIVTRCGYEVQSVAVDSCLHLKSAITEVAPGVVVLNPDWVDGGAFRDHKIIEVDPSEPSAANVLRVGDRDNVVLCAAAYPRTNARLSAVAIVHTIDVSELAKAEGALTCCSLIFKR